MMSLNIKPKTCHNKTLNQIWGDDFLHTSPYTDYVSCSYAVDCHKQTKKYPPKKLTQNITDSFELVTPSHFVQSENMLC